MAKKSSAQLSYETVEQVSGTMDDSQLITLGLDIRANTDPNVQGWVADGSHNQIAAWYNETSNQSPAVWVFKASIDRQAFLGVWDWGTDYEGGFKDDMEALQLLVGAEFDPRPEGNRDALNVLFTGASDTKNAALAFSTRNATPAESLYTTPATGPGGGSGGSQGQSAIASFDGSITDANVSRALELTS